MNVVCRLLPVVLLAVACASTKPLIEQRTTIGPMADEVWIYRVGIMNGREPTFDERRLWETQLELAMTRYLARDEELASSPQLSTFRFLHQPAVGMSKEAVLILLDAPDRTSTDAGEMEKLARKYWPQVRTKAPIEVWTYPLGWELFFTESRLVDVIQYQPPR